MSDLEEEEFYKQKYLKYKAKYLEARKNEIGGGTKCGKYVYFLIFPELLINDKEYFENIQKMLIDQISSENNGDKVEKIVNSIRKTVFDAKRITFKSAYIEIANKKTFSLIQMNDYGFHDKEISDTFITEGITQDENGNLISKNNNAVDLLSKVYHGKPYRGDYVGAYKFNYYFVKNYSCLFYGKKEAKKEAINKIKLINYKLTPTPTLTPTLTPTSTPTK
jgi:hypothetical protein